MSSVNYKDIQFKKTNLNTIAAMKTPQDGRQTFNAIVDDLLDYLGENFAELVSEIILGRKNKEKLHSVIEDWLIGSDAQYKGFLKGKLITQLTDNIVGWGILQPLVEDPEITNIFTNEKLEVIKRVRGRDVKTNIKFESVEELEKFIKSIMIRTKTKISRDVCIVDAFDHIYRVRINAAISGSQIKPEVVRKPYVALRTYQVKNFTREFFVNNGTFSDEIADFIEMYMLNCNVIFAGEPDAGKTTMIEYFRHLKYKRDPMRRVIRIEEEAEFNFPSDNSVSFFERKTDENIDDVRKKYDMAEFARVATRLAGKDVSVSETRDKEAWYLMRLLDMGYQGEAAVHGSNPASAIQNLAFLMSLGAPNVRMDMLIQRVCEVIDFIVHISHRKVITITELRGYDYDKQRPILNHVFDLQVKDDGTLYWSAGELSQAFIDKKKVKDALKQREV